jgi:hypothetical protein
MKRIAILVAILSITVSANAGMFITVDGVVDPSWDIYLTPSDIASIGLYADIEMPQGSYFVGIAAGDPGSLDDSEMTWIYPDPGIIPPPEPPEIPGWESIIEITFIDTIEPIQPVIGQLVDNIIFHCEGLGNVTIGLFDGGTGELLDSQLIHQIPEPGTIALLGLGVLLLKRRR